MRFILLLFCTAVLSVPAAAQVDGVYWDDEGNVKEAVFQKQDMLSDANQYFMVKQGSKMAKLTAGMAAGYAIEGDTFVSKSFEGQPLFLKKLYGGQLSLYTADEVVLHQVLIERTGSSPLNPLATNMQRTYNKDESFDTPIGILMWEDGEYLLINPNKKADGVADLKRFLSAHTEAITPIPANQKTISMDYLKGVAARYNEWHTKKNQAEGDKTGF